jgi:esterase/lipase
MPSKKKLFGTVGIAIVFLLLLYIFDFFPSAYSRLRPPDTAGYIPQSGDSFDFYLAQNRQRIRAALSEHFFSKQDQPFGAAYSLDDVVQMRSPFQIPESGQTCDDPQEGGGKGFLLIHGLSDSPYLLSAVAQTLSGYYPCALIRALLIPGHGTVPGDLRAVTLDDWERATTFGIEGFPSDVNELYMVGYSNGSSLFLNYLDQNNDNELFKGLILLSPGLRADDSRIYLAPYFHRLVKWVNVDTDTDAAKYESFATNAAAEFHKLTTKITDPNFEPVSIPVFMAMSSDDTTVDNFAAVEFFCNKVNNTHRQLLWYRSTNTEISPGTDCDGLNVIDVAVDNARFVNHSHVAITLPSNDPHYGIDGNYPSCLAYSDDLDQFAQCINNDADTVYGENTIRDDDGLYQGKLVRRTTFNPLYDEMMNEVRCFIDQSC